MDTIAKMQDAAKYISSKMTEAPKIGIILGSGLGGLVDEIIDSTIITYKDIPNFPVSTVKGHKGELILGKVQGQSVLVMNGRFHFYEGYNMTDVVFPVRVMRELGINTLIVTNACGGMNPSFKAGNIMLIEDHINFMGTNPLWGPNNEELGPRFPDISRAYTPELMELAKNVAASIGVPIVQGVYCAISGPNYLTRAELRMLRGFGADAVGMSTVPEVMACAHMGMNVLGISCITDMAIPDELEPIDHETVMNMAKETGPKFVDLVKNIIKEIII